MYKLMLFANGCEDNDRRTYKMEIWFLYLIRCKDGSLYTGISTDVKRRFEEHRGGSRGSKYLRGKAPLELVLKKKIGDKGLALKVEDRVRKLTKIKKELLVEGKIGIREIKRAI